MAELESRNNYVVVRSTALYSSPDSTSQVTNTVDSDQLVEGKSEKGGWVEVEVVKLNSKTVERGWVKAEHLEKR